MTDSKFSQADFNKLSNAEKYKTRVAVAYGKDARPKFYKKGLAVAQAMDAKTKPVTKKTPHKKVASKTSVW